MPATMSLTSTAGTFNFSNYELPLISRGLDYVRVHPSAPTDRKRVDVVLSGFFEGNDHSELMTKYQALKAILSAGQRVTWAYNDGANTIANGPVTITGYSEPQEWKQYDGDYQIEFYYFERASMPAYGSLSDELKASFSNTAGTITLNPFPSWSRQVKPRKESTQGPRLTPSGEEVGSEVTITLKGSLVDASLSTDGPSSGNPSSIYTLQQSFIDILTNASSGKTGTLTYGYFTEEVYIEDVSFAEGINIDSFDYTIVAKYFTADIIRMSTKVRYGRIHSNPQITERPFCGDRRIRFGNQSGQDVTYSLSLEAESVSVAQDLLATEVAALVVPGGIEMPGGSEDWDYDNRSVSVTINKFYNSPILSNM